MGFSGVVRHVALSKSKACRTNGRTPLILGDIIQLILVERRISNKANYTEVGIPKESKLVGWHIINSEKTMRLLPSYVQIAVGVIKYKATMKIMNSLWT